MTRHDDLDEIQRLRPRRRRALANIDANLPGYGTGGGGRPSGLGNRTMALALRGGASGDKRDNPAYLGSMSTDEALKDRAELIRLNPDVLERAHHAGAKITRQVDTLKHIIDRWDLSDEAKANIMSSADEGGEPGCRSCARINRFSDIHRNGLCWFCLRATPRVAALYEWDDELPPKKLVEWHHDRGKENVTTKVISEAMLGQKRRLDTVDTAS